MRKALIPLLASLALCGAATAAMVMSTAHAQPAPREPMMLPQNNAPPIGRGFNRPAPADMAARLKDMCDNSVARETGRLAYLETRLDLTSTEQPLFQRWKDAVLGVAKHRAEQCNNQVSQRLAERQAAQPETPGPGQEGREDRGPRRADRLDPAARMAREEDRLKQRLADIQAERPALEAFTNALTPAQKSEFTRAADERGGQGRNMLRNRFAMGPRGPMGRMGPGEPQDGPPLQR